ncbi:MAG: DUF6572 domain-containing protein [Opitutaceae bacterium]
MSVDQRGVIDFVGRSKAIGDIVLTVSDHLGWDEPLEHLYVLQEKINCYLGYVESGQLVETYADAKDKKVQILIIFRFRPPPGYVQNFLVGAKEKVEYLGHSFSYQVHEERA